MLEQGHDKYIFEAADTDATMECAVVFAGVRSNGVVDTCPQQAINSQQYTKRYFLWCPPGRHYCEDENARIQWQLMFCRELW
jgi:hypothetical protein